MHRIHSFTTRLGIALSGARVLCLGAAFKAGVSDVRNSRAVRVMELLQHEGADVAYADPLVEALSIDGRDVARVAVDTIDASAFDLIVVLVRNPAWPVDALRASGVPTFDAVNALDTPTAGTHERL